MRDGFIHFSTAAQVPETATRHFAGQPDLLLVAVAAERLGDALRWEPSRGGALFPHLYAPLPLGAVLWVADVRLDATGRHVFPVFLEGADSTRPRPMTLTRLTAALVATTLLVSSPAGSATAIRVLFIGNSFTFAVGSPVRFYRPDTVHRSQWRGHRRRAGLFESFTRQAGLDYDVSLETSPGKGLDFHLAEKAGVVGSRGWDTVVMHGYSTLDADKPRDPAKLIATSARMADLAAGEEPEGRDLPDGDLGARRSDVSGGGRLGRHRDRA